jgi:diacylglycerol kinase family enzyme
MHTETTLERAEELAERILPERTPKRRMLVIVNPYATTVSDRLKNLVVYALQSRYTVEAVDTEKRGHATQICREAAREGYDVVVAFGGDGTANEAANGLVGSDTPLTVLPGGSTNVWCRTLGIPNDVVDATEHLLSLSDRWEPRAVDLGRVNGRAFTFAAGMGLDASVVERVDANPAMKRRFGAWYFTQKAIGTFMRRYVVRPPKLTVSIDGEQAIGGVSAFFQNGQPYTYFKTRPINLIEGARLDSGDLAGVVLTRANPIDVPTVLARALTSAQMTGHRRVEAFTGAGEVVVRSADGRPVPWHVDGDHVADDDEVRVTVEPGALRVIA